LKLVKWDNENADSTNDSIKRQAEYGKAIGQSARVTISGIIRSLDTAIEGRKKRIAQMETYLIGERLPSQSLKKSRDFVNKVKELHQSYDALRQRYQNDLRNMR
jgi:hypothetical protein